MDPWVGILTGSSSDLPIVEGAFGVLNKLKIPYDVRVLSAHRTPAATLEYASSARERGLEVLIACAGMSAHLAGVVAAHTTLPVIGVPVSSGALAGVDALLSTVQMPSGVPVASVGVNGAKNAAWLAARILTCTHPELIKRLEDATAETHAKYDSGDHRVLSKAGTGWKVSKKAKSKTTTKKKSTKKKTTKKRATKTTTSKTRTTKSKSKKRTKRS